MVDLRLLEGMLGDQTEGVGLLRMLLNQLNDLLKCVRQSKVIVLKCCVLCSSLWWRVFRSGMLSSFLISTRLITTCICESQHVTKPLGPGLFVRFGVGKRRLMLCRYTGMVDW